MDAKLEQIAPLGLRSSAVAAGIRRQSRLDMALLELSQHSQVAALFTLNAFSAAPVDLSRKHLSCAQPRYFLINSGNANAGMGEQGTRDALQCCTSLATLAKVPTESILNFSTGVIGEPMPMDKILKALPVLWNNLGTTAWPQVAQAIMTTDTRPKGAHRVCQTSVGEIRISGIAKGSGMIHPNMGTMLAFVVTDAALPKTVLHAWLKECVAHSFHRITVDGDTSTNDSCVLAATAAAKKPAAEDMSALKGEVMAVFSDLAKQIVEDGEGVTRPFVVSVHQGATVEECLLVARAVSGSMLVKTAVHARDPNWGRILAAVGYAGISALDVTGVRIQLNDVVLVERGARSPQYREAHGRQAMMETDLDIAIYLGRGDQNASIYSSDLSAEYVRINAEYRS